MPNSVYYTLTKPVTLTILHISDLHRDPDHPISNSALLDSLERDREHYCTEISQPDLIIVSGDIVQGISSDDAEGPAKLQRQYAEAEQFLAELTEIFLDGNRERTVIVPGNHDVSYYHSTRSMSPLRIDGSDLRLKRHLVHQIIEGNSNVRWSWDDLRFYEIKNNEMYLERLQAFASFYTAFYRGARRYSLQPQEQYEIFDYPELNVSVAAFNSCFNNDSLNRQGAVHSDCVSDAARMLRRNSFNGRLLFAVWHHNTQGGPMQSDYLDQQILQVLIDEGFSIGFHGHQHRTQLIDEKFLFGRDRKMIVISAGSLCAAQAGLPLGYPRAYNIVELDTSTMIGKIHVREMRNAFLPQPIWEKGHPPMSSEGVIPFTFDAPPIRSQSDQVNAILGQAEQLVRLRQFNEAIPLLRHLSAQNQLARRLLLECYVECGDDHALALEFYPPQTPSEVVYVADALWSEKMVDELRVLLSSSIVSGSSDPSVRDMVRKYKGRLDS